MDSQSQNQSIVYLSWFCFPASAFLSLEAKSATRSFVNKKKEVTIYSFALYLRDFAPYSHHSYLPRLISCKEAASVLDQLGESQYFIERFISQEWIAQSLEYEKDLESQGLLDDIPF